MQRVRKQKTRHRTCQNVQWPPSKDLWAKWWSPNKLLSKILANVHIFIIGDNWFQKRQWNYHKEITCVCLYPRLLDSRSTDLQSISSAQKILRSCFLLFCYIGSVQSKPACCTSCCSKIGWRENMDTSSKRLKDNVNGKKCWEQWILLYFLPGLLLTSHIIIQCMLKYLLKLTLLPLMITSSRPNNMFFLTQCTEWNCGSHCREEIKNGQ